MRFLHTLLLLAAPASAQTFSWCLHATGSEVVPPVSSPAICRGLIWFDSATSELSWIMVPMDLTGTHLATHFHGPAPAGQKAGVQVQVGVGNVLESSRILDAQDAADLLAGLWYVNFHSSVFTGGNARGQVDHACQFQVLCKGAPNSARPEGARLVTGGDLDASANALTFAAAGLPPNQFGYLLIGAGTGQVTPPGSSGQLCLTGAPIGRFNQQVLFSNAAGVMGPFTPDIANLPNPPGGSILAGETWGFQGWFRDIGGTSNFTDAVALTFV